MFLGLHITLDISRISCYNKNYELLKVLEMFRQFLEGFAIGLVIKAVGVRTVVFWVLIFLVLFFAGLTVFQLNHQGADLSLLYTVLGYAGKMFLVFVLFLMGRGLVRNPKLLIAAVLLIITISIMQFFLGIGGWQGSILLFVSLTVPLVLVWVIDRTILNLKAKKRLQKGAL